MNDLPFVPETIETERLLLRGPQMNDEQELLLAVHESLSEFSPWLDWATEKFHKEEARRYLIGAYDVRGICQSYSFFLTEPQNRRILGFCSLSNIDWNVPRAEIGFWQRTTACGQGFMTEAVLALCETAVEYLGAYRVEINCDSRNTKSIGVAERAGFSLEAHLHNDRRDHFGVLADTLVFGRIR